MIENPAERTPPDDGLLSKWLWLAFALVLLLMAWPWLTGRATTHDDLGAFHLPVRDFYARALRQGQSYDWMPGLFGGFYLTGEGQAGSYHPWHWLLYRCLPLRIAFGLEVLASYPVLVVGMLFWLRRYATSRSAALFGAFTFTFGSFNLLHFVHLNAIAVIAHIPWLLVAIDRLAAGPPSRRVLAGVPLLTASQIWLGYPQYVWFSVLAEAFYATVLFRRSWSKWAVWSGLKGLGVLLGAVQILPTWDWLQSSQRVQEAGTYFVKYSFEPLRLAQLVTPALAPNSHELGFYLGAVPLLLVLVAWWRAPRDGSRQVLLVCTAAAAGALWLALGSYGGLFLLQRFLPVVGSFRVPARYLLLVQLAVAPLIVRGFDNLLRPEPNRPALSWKNLGWIPALSLVGSLGLLGRALAQPSRADLYLVLAPLFSVAAVIIILAAATERTKALAALIGLTLADTALFAVAFTAIGQGRTIPDMGHFPVLPAPAGQRIAVQRETLDAGNYRYRGNELVQFGWQQIDGYAGLPPRSELFGPGTSVAALRIAGVRWVLAAEVPAGFPGLKPAMDGWCEVPDPLARFRLVGAVRASADPRADVIQHDPADVVLVESLPADTVAPDPAAQLRVVRDEPGWIELETNSQTNQFLVVNERFHRGWHCRLDGSPATLLRAYGDFQGCVVPAGGHRLALRFAPASLRWGQRGTLLGMLLTGLVAWFGGRRPADVAR